MHPNSNCRPGSGLVNLGQSCLTNPILTNSNYPNKMNRLRCELINLKTYMLNRY